MFQRLDRMRKHSFGSMIVFGENNNNSVSGLWMWRGHELAFTVCISVTPCLKCILLTIPRVEKLFFSKLSVLIFAEYYNKVCYL